MRASSTLGIRRFARESLLPRAPPSSFARDLVPCEGETPPGSRDGSEGLLHRRDLLLRRTAIVLDGWSCFSAARQARRAALLVSWPAASATSKRTEPARSLPRHSTDTRQHLHATTEPAAYRRFFILFSRGEGIGGYTACP